MSQNFTSRATAVNGKAGKLPAIYKKINLEGLYILDIGCGAEVAHIRKFARENGAKWYGIDPYNRTDSQNRYNFKKWQKVAESGAKTLVISSNVLNVIDDDRVVAGAVNAITVNGGAYAVTVYEGNGSGIGKQTGVDQWQRNEKLKEYLKYFSAHAVIRKGVITNAPELVK